MTDKEAHTKQLQQQYLHLMGIKQWVLRDVPLLDKDLDCASQNSVSHDQYSEPKQEIPVKRTTNPNQNASNLDWPQLQTAIQNCTVCDLSEARTRTVFGAGHPQARLMIVGAAPGDDEDRQGQPFMGKAGQLLTEMLSAIGFTRDQVFITNVLKCRPLADREPSQVERACCQPFLLRQISLIQPKIILAAGLVAAHTLLGTTENIAKLRGKLHSLSGSDVPVFVSYHPSYLLKAPLSKGKSWQDLKQVMQLLKQEE